MTQALAKKRLRDTFAAKRRALSPGEVASAGRAVCDRLRCLSAWSAAREVLLYMPIQNEIDVRPLLDDLLARGVKALLPRCRPGEPGAMDLACPRCREHLVPGAYGILEPDPAACPSEPDASADLIVVPGLAFDRTGYRLGFGGGYYDRLLSCRTLRTALTIGAAYAFQVVAALPTEPWDVRLRAICTENEYFETGS
jgi:5-formyltetrahydrofolate cyclo-ligase